GPVSSDTYSLDTIGPDTTITARPPSPGNDLSPTWSFTTEAGATTECRLDDSSGVIDAWAPCASPKSFDLAGLGDGDYTFSVRATDPVGNTGASASNTYRLDTSAPSVTITLSPPSPGSGPSPTWSFW